MIGKVKTVDLVRICFCTGLIIIGTFIRIPAVMVPITLQPLMIMTSSLLLKKGHSTIAVGLYLLLGLIGLPVFTGGGGLAYIFKPSFGYLLGFLPMSYVISALSHRNPGSLRANVLACIAGEVVLYLVALPYVVLVYGALNSMGINAFLVSFMLIFLPNDLLSCAIASLLASRLYRQAKQLFQN